VGRHERHEDVHRAAAAAAAPARTASLASRSINRSSIPGGSKRFFFLSKASRLTARLQELSQVVEQLERQADYSPAAGAEFKNKWRNTSTAPHTPSWLGHGQLFV